MKKLSLTIACLFLALMVLITSCHPPLYVQKQRSAKRHYSGWR